MIKLSSQARQWFRKATLNFPTQMLWSKTSIINHPRITPDWNSERPTLQQQLKLFSAKHTRSNKSRSPSREQSTTKSTKGSRNCKIESRNCKIKTNQTGNTSMDHTHQNLQKIQTEQKVQESWPKWTNNLQNWRPNRKNRITECNFINQRHNENFVKLWRRLKKQLDICSRRKCS